MHSDIRHRVFEMKEHPQKKEKENRYVRISMIIIYSVDVPRHKSRNHLRNLNNTRIVKLCRMIITIGV